VAVEHRRTRRRREPEHGVGAFGRRSKHRDERFIRMWEYYLSISEAGFATGVAQDYQMTLERGRGLGARVG
jgi:hypothetical protein